MLFKDRIDAGKKLAEQCSQFKNKPNFIVLGLPRGGVVVASEIAKELHLPLDIIVVHKIGVPFQPELAVGALTEQGIPVWNKDLKHKLDLHTADLAPLIDEEKKEIERRLILYRSGRKPLDLHSKIVLLVDDGIATGTTMRAAILTVRNRGASKIVVAVPLSSREALVSVAHDADETICLNSPGFFPAIGSFYQDFSQVSDEQVIACMESAQETEFEEIKQK